MLDFLTKIATTQTAEESTDLLGSLGIDWQMLIFQMIGFILLVLIIKWLIYPKIVDMLDRRDEVIDAAAKAAKEAQDKAEKSEVETAKLLSEARKEAGDIIDVAKKESADIVASAESDATRKADAIVENAKVELGREIENAKKALRSETVELVAVATEKIVGSKIDSKDEKLIADAIKEKK